MKKRKIIIHAGLHKTGSSSIQIACQKNSDFLLSRKIIYPSFGSEKWANHSIPFSVMFMDNQGERSHSVRAEFSSPEQRVDAEKLFRKIFIDEVARAEDYDVLISGEDVSLFSENELFLLKSFLVENFDCKVDVIIYIRDPIGFAVSNAQELVRAGLYTLGDALKIGGGNLQRIKPKINNFVDVFGFDAVKVFSYDCVAKEHKDIVQHFVKEILAVDGGDFSLPYHNTSMSLEKSLVLSAVQDQDKDVWSFAYKSIPYSGSKIIPGPSLKNQLWNASLEDRSYVWNNFNISFDDIKLSEYYSPEIDLLNLANSLAIIENKYVKLTRKYLLDKMSVNIRDVFPEIYQKILSENFLAFLSSPVGMMSGKVKGRLGGVSGNTVYGWARYLDCDNAVSVGFFLDNVDVGSVLANQSRSDLLKIFNQNCAFFYKIPNLDSKSGSVLRAVNLLDGVDLENSPIFL